MRTGTSQRSSSARKRVAPAAAEQRVFGPLPGRSTAAKSRPLAVCVVTSEIIGPAKGGGIGTATTALIEDLARNGNQVTVLYTQVQSGQPDCQDRNWAHWVEHYAAQGVRLLHIPHTGHFREWLVKSWLVKQHLLTDNYGLIYFNDHHGSGYYALAAKRAGLRPFKDTVCCVIAHGGIEYAFNTNDQRMKRATDLQMIAIERRSVEWADVVISPSQYLLDEYTRYGWQLPASTYRQPLPFSFDARPPNRSRKPIDELVFFGRLETRKGLWLFCEALDRMGPSLRNRRVTFLGRANDVSGIPSPVFIMKRAERWACDVRLILDHDQEQALEYLSAPGRAAIMPSLADNSPCAVYECMAKRIPFVITSGTGAAELVNTECHSFMMCEANAIALSQMLTKVFSDGLRCSWPQFDVAENLMRWKAWGQRLGDPRERQKLLNGPAPAAASVRRRNGAEATDFLFIDDRSVGMGTMFDRVQRLMERVGPGGRVTLLSERSEPLASMIQGAMEASAAQLQSEFRIISATSLQSYLDTVKKRSACLFVCDICDELNGTFIVQSHELLTRKAATGVSCITASRRREADEPAIELLPAGDLPTAGGIGMPITSSAWAVATEQIGTQLRSSDFSDPTTGTLTPSADLGQILFHRLVIAERPVLLIPEVGAIRTAPTLRPRFERHWYRSAEIHADAMGLAPFIGRNPAPWLAASSFGYRGARTPEWNANLDLLPANHPIRDVSHSGRTVEKLARFAAALGRADQAVQIAIASQTDPTIPELLASSIRSIRARPLIDLRALLSGEIASDRATDVIKMLRASAANLKLDRQGDELLIRLADSRLKAGAATFFDIMLSGHETCTVSFSNSAGSAAEVVVAVIDQATGSLLGDASTRAVAGKQCMIEIPLGGVHGLFCLIVEFRSFGKSQAASLTRLEIA